MNLELEIYNHIQELIKQAEDLHELERWITRERDLLKTNVAKNLLCGTY